MRRCPRPTEPYNTIPTLLGNDGTGAGNYLNDHPVGSNATVSCGGQYNWDCTMSANGTDLDDRAEFMPQFVNELRLLCQPERIQQHAPWSSAPPATTST